MFKFDFEDWGLIEYYSSWDKQKNLVAEIQSGKKNSTLVFCEHPSVITIGKSGSGDNVVIQESFLKMMGISVVNIDRGGDVTLHNPGQLVGYPIFNLANFKQDLHWFLREIEQCLIELVGEYGIVADRVQGMTGVWIENQRKIAAMGMHCSRWVTSHGFALNVNNNLMEFSYIVPCGIKGKDVTSIKVETGSEIDFPEVKSKLLNIFRKHFN